jgi:hypothetical protein
MATDSRGETTEEFGYGETLRGLESMDIKDPPHSIESQNVPDMDVDALELQQNADDDRWEFLGAFVRALLYVSWYHLLDLISLRMRFLAPLWT